MRFKEIAGQMSLFEDVIPVVQAAVNVVTCYSSQLAEIPAYTANREAEISILQYEVMKKISYAGKGDKKRTKELLEQTAFTGNEGKDRLLIQKLLDENSRCCTVLYDHNMVYPSRKLIKELKQMQKTNSLLKMTKEMYSFLSLNFDIAHYDRIGFIQYYDGKFSKLYEECLKYTCRRFPLWRTDIATIINGSGILDE